MQFSGEDTHVLDSKGRISLPAAYRKELPKQVIISKGFDNTLFMFTAKDREEWLNSLVPYDDLDPDIRKFYRDLNAGAATVEIDSAGRINIPANLREFADLKKDVVLLGNRTRLEFWDADRWNEYNDGDIDGMVSTIREKKKSE